jgi:Photoprotection regulator fluorescence recovery protein
MNPASSSDNHPFTAMHNLKWSPAEKAVARRVFERALQAELQEIMQEARQRGANIHDSDQLWELEAYLKRSREGIDRKYDYRYSVLPEVFGILLHEGRISEAELHELREDKLYFIRSAARARGSRRIG